MPVGKVFNAAENQVLFSPVTNHYRGKAIRADISRVEKENELRDIEIESAPSKMRAAIEKVKLIEDQLRLENEKLRGEISDDELARQKEVYGPVLEEAKVRLERDGDIGLDWINKSIQSAVKRLGPEEEEKFKTVFAGSDGVLNHDEFALFGLAYGIQQEPYEDKKPSTHINYMLPDRSVVAARPDSPEADEIVARGGVVAGSSNAVLGVGDEGQKIRAADESFILRMVGQHFGGLFDEKTDKVAFTDPTKQRRASQITALATDLLADGAANTRAAAVRQAMVAYGEKWQEPGEHEFDIEAAAKELGFTVADLQFTAQKRSMSAEEVYTQLKAQ